MNWNWILTCFSRCTSVLWPKTNTDETAAKLSCLHVLSYFCDPDHQWKCLQCKNDEDMRDQTGSNTLYAAATTKTTEVRWNFCSDTYLCWLKAPPHPPKKDLISGGWKRERRRDRCVLQQALQQEQQPKVSSLSGPLSQFVRITRCINKSSQISELWI